MSKWMLLIFPLDVTPSTNVGGYLHLNGTNDNFAGYEVLGS
jgi:hypothetical protein